MRTTQNISLFHLSVNFQLDEPSLVFHTGKQWERLGHTLASNFTDNNDMKNGATVLVDR